MKVRGLSRRDQEIIAYLRKTGFDEDGGFVYSDGQSVSIYGDRVVVHPLGDFYTFEVFEGEGLNRPRRE
jgi:hypothetical protein